LNLVFTLLSACIVAGCGGKEDETIPVPPSPAEATGPPHWNAPGRLYPDTPEYRSEAARRLSRKGFPTGVISDPDGSVELNELLRLLGTEDLKLWARVRDALVEFGPRAVPGLLEILDRGDEIEKGRAIDLLLEIRTADAILPLYRRAREEEDGTLLVRALGALPHTRIDALPMLIEALKSDHMEARRRAALELGDMGPRAAQALEPLLEALYDRGNLASKEVGRALARLGSVSIPGLVQGLESDFRFMQKRSAFALGEMGPKGAPAAPKLLRLWTDQQWYYDDVFLKTAFRKIGVDAILALVAKLKDADPAVRLHAVMAMEAIGPKDPSVIPYLMDRLVSDPDPEIRCRAAIALAKAGPQARSEVITILLGMMQEKANACVSIETLGEIASEPGRVVPSLMEKLEDPDRAIRYEVLVALARFGPGAALSRPALLELMEDKDPCIRENTILALGRIGFADYRVVRALMESARANGSAVRKAVARALRSLREISVEAFRAMQAYEGDPDGAIRKLAREILSRWAVAGEGRR
jgi:HEAT repeat protein